MCGYVGFTNDIEQADETLKNMMNKIVHRGPDSEGVYVDDGIALGFRRLSIIDLAQGDQPLFNEDGSMVLMFNGEIYNYQKLREELVEKGHAFKTHTDSEVLLHGYEEYGVSLLNRLRGMFSFVIWDKNNERIFGARDFFGIKPMYYALMDDTFMFGSEIKSFLPHPKFKKELNERALENYLSFQYSPTNETFFKNVFKLLPAHYFVYENNHLETTRYWEPVFEADDSKSLEQWIEEISETFEDSVEAHKISDVEVGSFLSSGVDSSYVAASANVDKTFTVGFDNEIYNEISYAKELSEYINVKNISKVITPEEYWSSLSKIQYHMDEPLADPSAVALYFVCNIASEHLKVVLSGEGADEIFGGYNVYKEPIEFTGYKKIPMFIRRFIGSVASLLPSVRGLNFLVRRGKTLEEWFIGNAFMFSQKDRRKLLKNPTDAKAPQALCKPYYDKVQDKDDVTKMQYLDIHMWMAGDILLKADKMSMANSLELRVPFLDKEIMALAAKIPTKYRVNEYNTKYAMRQAALKKIPQKSADKKKLGFPVPTRVWLKEDKYYDIVKTAFLSDVSNKYFNTEMLIGLLDAHKAGKKDNSRKIWTVFMFLKWYDEYFVKEIN
ncbi:MAG: hypothetical protein K0R90_550 [Oscillospiraceae bacterium]|jgi:asparagine synthase (glutamine-hydrolysing)|nr:hypothetical protein [Oscillospiraceae bacterium]